MDFMTLIQLLDSTVRLATPLLLACLAGLFSERAGIFDIGLEGKMLAAAFFSAALAAMTGSVWLGLLAGFAASMAPSVLPAPTFASAKRPTPVTTMVCVPMRPVSVPGRTDALVVPS